jgi:hypothetical protein
VSGRGRGARRAELARGLLVLVTVAALAAAWGVGLASADVSSSPGLSDSSAADSPQFADAGASDVAASAVALSSSGTLPGFQGQRAAASTQPPSSAARTEAVSGALGARLAQARASLDPRTAPPSAPGVPARQVQQSRHGFDGIDNLDQYSAGTGSYSRDVGSVTPPDQGLCAGNGFLLELVNHGARVFDTRGTTLTLTVDINQFFGAPPIVMPDGSPGQVTSDPRCAYDAATGRWFATMFGVDLASDLSFTDSWVHLIVSNTSDPRGAWTDYSFRSELFGRANSSPCPC